MKKIKFSFYTLLAFCLFLSQQVLSQELPVCSDLPGGTRQLRVAIIPDTQGDDAEYGVAQKEITGIKNHILNEVGNVDFVLHVGDVTDAKVEGVPSDEQEAKILNELQIYNDLFTQPLADEGIPFYPIVGNHDYRKRGPWKVVFPYLFDNTDPHGAYINPTTVPGGTSSNPNNSNYSYTVKHGESNTYFVLLDAFNGGGYCDWLIESYQNIRQESPDARIFSIQHMNLFSLAVHGPLDYIVNPSANDTPQDFLNASTNYGIEGWFSGHNHYYHRAMYVDNDVNPVSFDYTVGAAAFKVYTDFEREPTNDHRVQYTKINRKPDGRYMANYQVMDIFEEFVVIKTYYSDEAANGAFSNFYLADEYIYSDNGTQTLVPSGASFSTISDNIQGDTFVGTEMDIVEGVNNDTRTFVAGNKTHHYHLNVTTGWLPKGDWHEGKQDNIQSDVLVLRGLANTEDNKRRTSPYLLKLSYDDTGMTLEQEKELDLISFLDYDLRDDNVGEWYLANYGTEVASEATQKVFGVPVSNNTLGDFGVDTEGNYVWAYIDYQGDFCVGTSDLELVEPVTISKSTIIGIGDTWNYVVNTVDDIDNWNKTTYDDSEWNNGPSPIGYNDPGLNTITTNAIRVFMRKSVSLTEVEKIQKIEFGVDYDDGYVLYVNGNEVDRQRVDDDPVSNTSTANAAINIQEQLMTRDITNMAKQHLINGENIFSIAILNANSTSSDLSIYPEIYIHSENAPEPSDTSGTNNKVKFLLQGDTQKIVNLAENTFYTHMDNTLTDTYTKDADLYMHMGDITEDDLTSNWEVAQTGIYKLDGKIPYVLNVGNNDGTGSKFVNYFPLSKYNGLPSFVSNYNDHRNVAHQYTFGGVDWLVISIWRFPGTAEISWAEGLIDAHPDKNVIIVNHTQGLGDGNIVWNMVKTKPNVHFMFLGHNLTMHEMLTADDGHPVGRVQTCWHNASKDHYYCVAELDVNAGSASFKYYSPVNANTTGDTWTWTGFDFGTPTTTGTNDAQFVSQQGVPATMAPGETASVSVTMKNTGTTTWTQGALYKLGSVNDNMDFGTNRVLMEATDNIAPGQNKTFTFDITAPTTPGTYNFQWKMVQDLVEWFGDKSQNVSVTVSDGPVVNDLTRKLMMGYQGWFLCEGDQSGPNEWRHWYKSTTTPTEANLSIDMWPDMSEYTTTYNTQMNYADGSTAKLFSSHDLSTTRKHFEWMRDYNIHGVYLQRFLGEIADSRFFAARNNVLQNVITSAAEYERSFAVMYDISGVPDDGNLYNKLITDWEYLVDTYDVLNSDGYVKQNNLPVVAIWGIGFKDRGLNPATFEAIIDYFHNTADPKYRAYVMGGVPDGWRTLSGSSETGAAWTDIYNSLDMISPWTVGRYSDENTADNWNTNFIVPDIAECNTQGIDYMPVIWPGFSWVNLHDGPYNEIPRNGGNFYWNQAYNAISSGAEFVYVAMFDEVDEGTAMFKVAETTADLPVNCSLVPLDADGISLPSDWYLQLADQTQQMLDGTIALTDTIPITPQTPGVNNATFVSQSVPASMLPGQTASVSITMNNSGTTTWTQAELYKLGSIDDNTDFGTNRVQLDASDNIAPGQSKTFTFDITAPTTPGTYNFQWKMVQDLVEWFGSLTNNVVITVEDTVNYLDDCDALTDWNSSAGLSLNTTDKQQGAACIEFSGSTTDEFKKVFAIPFNSGIPAYAAVLQFSYYVSDASLMGTANQVELGSGGKADVNEYNWNLSGLQTGWNQISLNISDAGGSADLNAINWFRIYNVKSGSVTTRIDGIKIIDNGAAPPTYALTVNSGTGDGNYEENAQVTITADDAPAGQEFDGWDINSGSPTIADVNASSTTLTMPAGEVSVTATYKDIVNRVDHTNSPIVAITRRAEINSTESADKAFDNTTSTKWLDDGGIPSTSNPSWIQIRLVSAAVADELTIASANDVPDRNPQDFVLKGSNDGSTYTTLGSWTNQSFANRFQVKSFTFSNQTAYSYYRLEITKNLGNLTMTQLSEIQLIGPENTEEVYLDECDALTGWNTSGSNTLSLSSDYLQGAASLKSVGSGTDEFKKAFSTPFNSGATAANGVLKFWYYVDDVSKLSNDGQVELGSGGAADVNEYHWGLRSGLVNGWNEVSLNISDAGISGGTPNLSAINWFRIYHTKSASATIRVDAIQVYADLNKSGTIVAGVDNLNDIGDRQVNIFPNPLNQDLLTVDLTGFGDTEKVDLSISNLMGQIVYSNTIIGNNKLSIDATDLHHGSIYLVTVKTEKTISTTKLMVQ